MDVPANGVAKVPVEVGIEMPEPEKSAAEVRKADVAGAAVRLTCLLTSVISLSVMVSSEQHATLSIYGFDIPVHSKWSFSESMECLVGVSAAAAAHSLVQMVMVGEKMVRRRPAISSRGHAWILFACDQAFAYAMMSAGSAAAGVANLNRTGIRHSPLPDFCKPLYQFCNRVTASITLAFLSCGLLAISAILDIIWLSRN